ncbi:MAG TPA: HAMP domain-containing sensor histidine kinase [Anaerolineales bacterium]|nr:HAMP domain-containing sensor histidine kinase [Anaerolineales bacterium]
MFSSIRSRLWLSYAFLVVTALGIVAIVLFIYLIRNPFLYRQTLEKLRVVQTAVVKRDAQSIEFAAERASRNFGVRIILFSRDRQVLLDTYANKEPALQFPADRKLFRNTPILRDASKAAWLYSIEKLSDNSFVMVATQRPRVSFTNILTDELMPLILESGLIALILSLAIAFFFARWIADPLQKVVVAANAPWPRNPSAEAMPVEVQGPHEVQELTRAFNSMIARMQASQTSQREFVANVSHELKTPLTSVQGFAQAILDGTADSNEARQQAAQVIYDESGRMHRMVLDLLDLARLDGGTADITMSPVNIPALLNAVAEKFTPQLQKAGLNITVDAAQDLPAIAADGDRLAQVFVILVDNSLKFTPNGGLISLHASAKNEELLVSVSDSGAGIPEEAQAHIFDRFFQADLARKGGEKHGAGLGLAIANEIVLAHSGRISVRSRLGKGTSIDVFLPLTQKLKL